jgi:cytochrome c
MKPLLDLLAPKGGEPRLAASGRAAVNLALFSLAVVSLAACGRPERGEAQAPLSRAALEAVAALPPPYDHADLANGRAHVGLCRSCHTLVQGGPNMTGPNLWDVFNRRAADHPGFDYSAALRGRRAAGLVWSAASLNRWLLSPAAFAPGTKMAFPGLKDPSDRRDVIAYLKANGAVDTPP